MYDMSICSMKFNMAHFRTNRCHTSSTSVQKFDRQNNQKDPINIRSCGWLLACESSTHNPAQIAFIFCDPVQMAHGLISCAVNRTVHRVQISCYRLQAPGEEMRHQVFFAHHLDRSHASVRAVVFENHQIYSQCQCVVGQSVWLHPVWKVFGVIVCQYYLSQPVVCLPATNIKGGPRMCLPREQVPSLALERQAG